VPTDPWNPQRLALRACRAPRQRRARRRTFGFHCLELCAQGGNRLCLDGDGRIPLLDLLLRPFRFPSRNGQRRPAAGKLVVYIAQPSFVILSCFSRHCARRLQILLQTERRGPLSVDLDQRALFGEIEPVFGLLRRSTQVRQFLLKIAARVRQRRVRRAKLVMTLREPLAQAL
jgi:hypothetical protein